MTSESLPGRGLIRIVGTMCFSGSMFCCGIRPTRSLPERLSKLVKGTGLRVADARRVMQNLYQDGFVRQSLQLGEALAEGGAGSDYTFYLDVADMAAELGDDAARDRWTIRAFEGIDFGFRVLGRVPFPTLHRIVSDVMALDAPRVAEGRSDRARVREDSAIRRL